MSSPTGTIESTPTGGRRLSYERHLDHSVDEVWAAITEPDRMRKWWGEAELDPVVGGHFKLTWLNTDAEGNTAVMNGEIVGLDPPRLFEVVGDIHGRLRFELDPHGDGCRLRFSATMEKRLDADMESSVLAGWATHLDILEHVLDGGDFDWETDWDGGWGLERWKHYNERDDAAGLSGA
jgi:uncharacterized protein YndB with AHSA1/START domain